MKIWKKRDTSGSRRSARLGALRLKQFGLYSGCAAAFLSVCVWAWATGSFSRAGDWLHEKTLQTTAGAGFRVEEILVTGRQRITAETLLSRIDIREGMPLFAVDLPKAQQAVSGIPWVDSVRLTRRLPGTIVIDIAERRPVALWQFRKKMSVIDANGTPLAESGLDAFDSLPLIVGEDAPQHVVQIISLLQAEPDVASRLESAARIGGRRWDLHIRGGAVVKLPEENTELALRLLAREQETGRIFDRGLRSIDLRLPDRITVEPTAVQVTDQQETTPGNRAGGQKRST